MQKQRIWLMSALMAAFVVLGLIGCTTERDAVDRSPKEALDKKMFDGEFFYKTTIVHIPYTVDYAFIGETNETKIIRWEIQKKWLIAYNIHDKVDTYKTPVEDVARDDNTEDWVADPNRTPILAFPILDHFDITYMDNAMTGEDIPMIVANHDRDWHESRYFLIDPSTNYVTNFEFDYLNITIAWENPFHREPVSGYTELEFYDRDDNYLDPRSWRENPTEVEEIDFKTQEIFTPHSDWRGWWAWDDVWEGIYWFINWEPSRITFRHNLVRVHRDELATNGFIPIDNQDKLFRKFSYFHTRRADYCTVNGVRDKCYHKWANYHNIAGDNKLHLRLSPTHPHYLVPSACAIAADYNDAFTKAKFALENDGSYVDEAPEQDAAEDFTDYANMDPEVQREMIERCLGTDPAVEHAFDANDMFTLKPQEFMPYNEDRDGYDLDGNPLYIEINPCNYYPYTQLPEGYTFEMCFPEGRFVDGGEASQDVPLYKVACEKDWDNQCKRDSNGTPQIRYKHELGDIAESFMYWVDAPTEYGILGVSQWSANPETGQTFSGSSHIAGWVVYYVRNYALDLFDIHAGEKTYLDIINPDYGQPSDKIMGTVKAPWVNMDGTIAKNADFTEDQMAAYKQDLEENPVSYEDAVQELQNKWRPLSGRLDLNAIKGSQFESMMVPSGYRDWIYPNGTELSGTNLDVVSPVKYGSLEGLTEIFNRETEILGNCYFLPEFLDGVVAKYVEEKLQEVAALEATGISHEAAYKTVRDVAMGEFDALVFKGVAQHEIGHSMGLRHNFIASADERNYIGNAPWEPGPDTGYWAEKPEWQRQVDEYKAANPDASGEDVWLFARTIKTDRDRYMYASVMDYQDQYYIHAAGLGKYDYAALKFMYGHSIEKYTANDSDNTTMRTKNVHFIDEATNELRVDENTLSFEQRADGTYIVKAVGIGEEVDVTENGDNVPFLMCPDELRSENPMCNVFDNGYTARDIVRYMKNSFNNRYYYRFFRRGNPRFQRDISWWGFYWRLFPFAHFALDFQYNIFQDKNWQNVITDRNAVTVERQEYQAAALGKDTYISNQTGEVTEFVPGGVGDMLLAGMEGFNFLLYDILYRPDVDAYLKLEYPEDPTTEYFVKNPYIADADTMESYGYDVLRVGADVGRYHRNRYDIQDDPRIIDFKRLRHGFSVVKEAAIYMMTNTGWPVAKYGRENMANAFHYVSQGFNNAVTHMLADVINEDHIVTFTPYCAIQNPATNKYEMQKIDIPVNAAFLWGAAPEYSAAGNAYQPPEFSICNTVGGLPMHAGWVYFDKFEPSFWAMYSMSNVTADQSIFQLFMPEVINASQYDPEHCTEADRTGCGTYAPLNPATEVEFLNVNGRKYYRARTADTVRLTPIYQMVKRASAIRANCDAADPDIKKCGEKRTLEIMEATIINNLAFGNFWMTIWPYFIL